MCQRTLTHDPTEKDPLTHLLALLVQSKLAVLTLGVLQ